MTGSEKICVVVPAYNEEVLLPKVLSHVPAYVDQTIVVDDGSTDRTAEIARAFGAIVISHPKQRGSGSSFQTGIDHALKMGRDLVVNIDVDNQFNPTDIEKLAAPIVAGEADFVTASRFVGRAEIPRMPESKILIHPLYHYRLGILYKQKALKDKAKTECERFLELYKDDNPGQPEVGDARKRLAGLKQ
jgi:glycosyltransferase involved in cell wall biosynthesis